MTITFDQLLEQAKVSLAPNGLWLAKQDRTCESMSRVFVAIRALIDSVNDSETKISREHAALSKTNSRLAADNSESQKEITRITKTAIARGLESVPEVSDSARNRILSVNGG